MVKRKFTAFEQPLETQTSIFVNPHKNFANLSKSRRHHYRSQYRSFGKITKRQTARIVECLYLQRIMIWGKMVMIILKKRL